MCDRDDLTIMLAGCESKTKMTTDLDVDESTHRDCDQDEVQRPPQASRQLRSAEVMDSGENQSGYLQECPSS